MYTFRYYFNNKKARPLATYHLKENMTQPLTTMESVLRRSVHTAVQASDGYVSVLGTLRNYIAPKITQNTRNDILSRLDRGFLFEDLNTTKRRLVFRPSRAFHFSQSVTEPPKYQGRVLEPMQYPGIPSVNDLLRLIAASETPEQVHQAQQYLKAYNTHKEVRANLRPEHFVALLKKSAEVGAFTEVYNALTVNRYRYRRFLTNEFWLEVLRVYALRVPALSHRSKNVLYKAHKLSPEGIGRELVLLYALGQFGAKFGEQYTKRIPEIADIIAKLAPTSPLNPLDAVLGIEGAKLTGHTELAQILEKRLEEFQPNNGADVERKLWSIAEVDQNTSTDSSNAE